MITDPPSAELGLCIQCESFFKKVVRTFLYFFILSYLLTYFLFYFLSFLQLRYLMFLFYFILFLSVVFFFFDPLLPFMSVSLSLLSFISVSHSHCHIHIISLSLIYPLTSYISLFITNPLTSRISLSHSLNHSLSTAIYKMERMLCIIIFGLYNLYSRVQNFFIVWLLSLACALVKHCFLYCLLYGSSSH